MKQTATIRWMIRKDLDQVLEIERLSFEQPWGEQQFTSQLRQRNIVGVVIENPHDETLVDGYCVYALSRNRIDILNLASHPDCRRNGVGTDLVSRLIHKLGGRRQSIQLMVRETNLTCCQFLRSLGFKATEVIRSPYVDCEEDAYWFEFRQVKLERV